MSALDLIVEARIREALAAGGGGGVPYQGRPLPPDEARDVPEDLRAAYRVLRNAGCVPEEVELRRSILRLEDLLQSCSDDEESRRLRTRLGEKTLRLRLLAERRLRRGRRTRPHLPGRP